MSIKKMKTRELLFVDTEATCWENVTRQDQQSRREVIEIGVVLYDCVDRRITDQESYLIHNPTSDVSEFCTQLTGITQEMIDAHGMSLGKAMKNIKHRFGSKNKPWFAWGAFDYNFLKHEQCVRQPAEFTFSDNFTNMSELYSMVSGLSTSRGMGKALNHLGIEMEGDRHRALPDALATCRIFMKMQELYSIGKKNGK